MDTAENLFYTAVWEGRLEEVKAAVESGEIDVSHRYAHSQDDTPLIYAVCAKQVPVAQYLISKGADINVQRRDGRKTPLHIAAQLADAEMVKVLVKAGAKLDVVDSKGMTAAQRVHKKLAPEARKLIGAELLPEKEEDEEDAEEVE